MTNIINRELHKFVLSACDTLYANRQLITQKVVKGMVSAYGDWSADDIELQVPHIINEWRLKNLAEDDHIIVADRVRDLEEQLCKYRISLDAAHKTINKLKSDVMTISQTATEQRNLIIAELRSLLTANKR